MVGFVAGIFLPVQHFSAFSAKLPLHTHLFAIYHRGNKKIWRFQRRMAFREAHQPLSSLGRQWLRPCSLKANQNSLAPANCRLAAFVVNYLPFLLPVNDLSV